MARRKCVAGGSRAVVNLPEKQRDACHGRSNGKPVIGITLGDPCGIGAEVIVKSLADDELRASARYVIFGNHELMNHAARLSGIRPFWFIAKDEFDLRIDSGVLLVEPRALPVHDWTLARPSEAGGAASLGFLDSAIEAVRKGALDAVVTGPISKTSWRLAGCEYPGHTEKLADAFEVRRYNMMFVAPGLRVALASAHVGLFDLRNHFNIGLVFQPIDLLYQALVHWFGVEHPRIGVAGLNPHAGEDGLFGDEEQRIIEPAMQMARSHGVNVEGPLPPDTLFSPRVSSRFDGIVAMYHDQGLIPVKVLAFDRAVNLTLGLPIIRTSPDHGTAFDIAGQNMADPSSMTEALRLAVQLAGRARSGWRTSSASVAATA